MPHRIVIAGLRCVTLVLGVALAGCDLAMETDAARAPGSAAPQDAARPETVPPSDDSLALARRYNQRESDLLTRGLLRRDGGGPDTPFSADDLAENFETIVFFDEFTRGLGPRRTASGKLRRWSGPVRVGAEFGASVPRSQRRKDTDRIAGFTARMGRITGHPITYLPDTANFHVLVMGLDDTDQLVDRLRTLEPKLSANTLNFFRNVPPSIECSVLAFAGNGDAQSYTKAIAVIRAELPDLLRLSCVHEEIAQGLGPANDSPAARPSIFNDDDEFALLTNHDELLLKMLYDPRLRLGMSADEARAPARIIARDLMGQAL